MQATHSPDDPNQPVVAGRNWVSGGESFSALDRIARLAALSLQAPAAVISLFRVGRLEPTAVFGLAGPTEQEVGEFANLVLEQGNCVIVPDARADSHFRRLPVVAGRNGFRFCAGAPIRAASGWTLGVLCVLDRTSRHILPGQILALSDFADLIAAEVSARLESSRPTVAGSPPVSSHDRTVAIFEDSNDVGLIYGFDGRLLAINTAAERVTGYSRQEALERRIDDLLAAEQRPLIGQATLAALGGALPEDREFTFLSKDYRRFVLEVRIRLVFQSGRPIAVQAVGRDVTRRRRAEQQRDRTASELERFNVHLRQLHRLSTASYDSLENLIRDYLRTGCELFAMPVGRFLPAGPEAAIVHGPDGVDCNEVCDKNPSLSFRTSVQMGQELFGELCFCSPDGTARNFGSHDTEIIELMARSIANSISEARMREQLAFQATHDPLTGLFNRSYQQDWLERALSEAAENQSLVAVALLDLDRFKQVNDIFGHSFGDVVLKRVADRMAGLLDPSDTLARMGGDEFTIVFTGLKEPGEAIRAAERLLDGLRTPFEVEDYEFVVTASLGLSFYPADARDAGTLLRQADAAMFRAKNRGKNDVECFTPEPSPPGFDRLDLENQLRRALDNREFELLFQPQVDLRGGLHGLEVLLVWNSPKLGRVLPGRFIPIAEECGLIVSIGSWVLFESCSQGARWQRSGSAPVRLAVNVSPLQFARTDFVETVAEALRSTGFPPGCLELEITESLIMRDVDEAVRRMARLRALGISIAIDDFGTGYSSLSYLRQLPVDALKIDRSFLPEIESATGTLPLVQTIISLAHDMGLRVLAEGVENDRQARLLYAAGCDRAQGHFFGEPLTAEDVARMPCRAPLSAP